MIDLRVLQLIDSLEAGGAERVAVNIANALVNKVQLSCLCATRKEGLLKHSIKTEVSYLFLNKKSTLDYASINKLKSYIVTNKINIIHAHSSSFFLATLIKYLLPQRAIKVIWHDHYGNSEFLEKRKSIILKLFSKSFSKILSVNRELVKWSKTYLNHKNVMYLPNFVVQESSKPITYLKGNVNKRIICLANLRPQKDHFTLLKAFEKISKKYPSWSLHLVGKDFNDIYSNQLRKLVKELDIKEYVFFYGSCQDIGHILSQSTIGVLSSESEGLPLSLLEYGLAGLPVIATDVGECANVIGRKNKNGFFVKTKDFRGIYLAICELIENENLRHSMAVAYKNHVNDNYSQSSAVGKLINVYTK